MNLPAELTGAGQAAYALARAQLRPAEPQVIRSLARAVTLLEAADLRAGVLHALAELNGPYDLDEAWGVWAETRHAALQDWLCERARPATYPPEVRVLSHLLLDQGRALADGNAEIVRPLLTAARDSHPTLAERARQALSSLTQPAAQDELCRQVVVDNDEHAQAAALQGSFIPREPRQRALFFLFTGQWQRYTDLDFDSSLLQAIYQTGSRELRRKLAELARSSGWGGYVDALAGGRARRTLDQLSPPEWEVIQVLLSRQKAWEELWRLAQSAPALHSARLLAGLNEHGWLPGDEHERSGFQELVSLAAQAQAGGPPREKLVFYRGELVGHTRLVTALAFSPDGRLLVSGGADRQVRLWPLDQPGPARILEGHQNFVLALALHPGGDLLASGSADGSVRLWELPSGSLRQQLAPQAGEVAALAFSPDGSLLASAGGERGVVRLWQAASGKLERLLKARLGQISALAFSADGQALAAQDAQKTIQIWELDEGAATHTLMESASAWDISPAGPQLATASQYGRVRLWQLPGSEMTAAWRGADGELLRFSPDGAWLAASDGSQVSVWELPGGLAADPPTHQRLQAAAAGRRVTALSFDPTSRLLAAGSDDQLARLWQVEGGALLAELPGFSAPVKHLRFSPAGDVLACADQASLRLWDLPELAGLLRLPVSQMQEISQRLQTLRRRPEIGPAEAAWLDFALALQRWHRRYDIHVEEPAPLLAIGEFDIILEG